MSESNDSTSLLGSLRVLYHQLVNRMTLARQKSYQPRKAATGSAELTKQLRAYIKQAPAPEVREPSLVSNNIQRPASPPDKPSPVAGTSPDTGSPGYVKPAPPSDHHRHVAKDSVGDKLMQSAWEHLHASVRFARLGNTETARLHASIMESSLKEAAHFLDDEVYDEFVQDLGKELNGLTELNK